MIRQIHYRDLARVIAAEESWADVIPVRYERAARWDDGHLREASELRLHISLVELASIWKIC